MRPGSAEAKEFFNRDLKLSDWKRVLKQYSHCVKLVATKKKSSNLLALDSFRSEEFVANVCSRAPKHMVLAELSKIMTWKLVRGKFRPLQKLVDSNKPKDVVDISTEAFHLAEQSGESWKQAINVLSTLKGVGVATASAVLSVLYPQTFPFMADEVMEAVLPNSGREYTMKAFIEMKRELDRKRDELLSEDDLPGNQVLTIDDVGTCVWIVAMKASLAPSEPLFDESMEESAEATSSRSSIGAQDIELRQRKRFARADSPSKVESPRVKKTRK